MIPALNRDGDILSDLVSLFGSIAGSESLLVAFNDDYTPRALMAEAAHETAPALKGKDVADLTGHDPRRRRAPVPHRRRGGADGRPGDSRGLSRGGIGRDRRDLGGHASTGLDEVISASVPSSTSGRRCRRELSAGPGQPRSR